MNQGKRNEEIYRELTPTGIGLCAAAGAVAEGITFWVLGIRLENVPVPVLIFLWGLFGILMSGVLIFADTAEVWIGEIRARADQRKRAAAWQAENALIAAVRAEMEAAVAAAVQNGIDGKIVSAQVIYRDVWARTAEDFCEEQRKAS